MEIELDPGQQVVLRAGYSANAEVVIREKNDVLLIPAAWLADRGITTLTYDYRGFGASCGVAVRTARTKYGDRVRS